MYRQQSAFLDPAPCVMTIGLCHTAAMINLNDGAWDDQPGKSHREGFRSRRRFVGRHLGCERLGASLWEVPPGELAYPYHYHLADEELLIVVSGDGELRTPDGWRPIASGDVVGFGRGENGAHQVRCTGTAPLRFLTVSTAGTPDVVVYPDSNKLGAFERRADGGGLWELYRRADAVDYWEGEAPPR